MLNIEELKKIEIIYNDKIVNCYETFNKIQGRYYTCIKFLSNVRHISRLTATWRLEVLLGRKLKSKNNGGNETCDHIDGDKTNDEPHNLQVLSNKINTKKFFLNNSRIGENNPFCKLKEETVFSILDLFYNHDKTIKNLSISFNTPESTIGDIIKRRTWKHIKFVIPSINNNKFFNNKNKIGSLHNNSILSEDDIKSIRLKYIFGKSFDSLSKEYNVSKGCISHIIKNDNWSHVSNPFYVNIYNNNYVLWENQYITINDQIYKFTGYNKNSNINSIYINDNKIILIRSINK